MPEPVTREELYSAIRVIETTHGFDDETTAVGEAWRVVRIVLSRLDAEQNGDES